MNNIFHANSMSECDMQLAKEVFVRTCATKTSFSAGQKSNLVHFVNFSPTSPRSVAQKNQHFLICTINCKMFGARINCQKRLTDEAALSCNSTERVRKGKSAELMYRNVVWTGFRWTGLFLVLVFIANKIAVYCFVTNLIWITLCD